MEPACECGEPEQNSEHIITTCPLHKPPSEDGLYDVGPEMRMWLLLSWTFDDDTQKKYDHQIVAMLPKFAV